jgi:drug/metabolite transporter (DMT)-like permease
MEDTTPAPPREPRDRPSDRVSAGHEGRTARLSILAAALLFSTGGAAIKASSFGGVQVASFRSGVAALALAAAVPSARRGLSLRALPVGVAYAAVLVLFVTATKLTTAANAIFLQSTAPLYVVPLGAVLLGERPTARDLGFVAIIGAGLALFFTGVEPPQVTAPDPALGNLLAAACGVAWALTLVGLRWLGRAPEKGSPGGAVVMGNLIACLVCLPWALPATGTLVDWALIGYLGVFQIGLAYALMTSGMRHVPALEASLLVLAEPALSPIQAWLVHGEAPSARGVAGGAIVIGASLAKSFGAGRGGGDA